MATKKLQILDGLNFVSYKEQDLTKEQRKQARDNIAEYKYNWISAKYSIFNRQIADWSEYISEANKVDMELANSIKSVVLASATSLGTMAFNLYNYSSSPNTASTIKSIIAEYENMKANGCFTGDTIYLASGTGSGECKIRVMISTNTSNGATHIIQIHTGSSEVDYEGYIYWNNDTQTIVKDNTSRKYSDKTLTHSNYYADAKSVGDALELKIDKTEIATDDEIIEMLAQEDMFPVVTDSDGSILSDENENILLW